ncbi:hypothetical protein DMENIID0001_142590 [Sergentomyia squamirostris]
MDICSKGWQSTLYREENPNEAESDNKLGVLWRTPQTISLLKRRVSRHRIPSRRKSPFPYHGARVTTLLAHAAFGFCSLRIDPESHFSRSQTLTLVAYCRAFHIVLSEVLKFF